MLQSLTKFSIRNGAVIVIAMLMIIAGGIYSYTKIPKAEYPNVDIPYINVSINYPGATPNQAYNDIGKLLEPKFSAIQGVQKLYSYSSTGYQGFTISVDMNRKDVDVDKDIQDAINQVQLPATASKPQIQNQSVSGESVYVFSVSASNASLQSIQNYVQSSLQPALAAVPGVGTVKVSGVGKKDIYIQVNPQKMRDAKVTWQLVQQTLVDNHFAAPVGNLNTGSQNLPIVVAGNLTTLDTISNLPVLGAYPKADGSSLLLKDIADIVYRNDPNVDTITRTNGHPGVVVHLIPAQGANTVSTVQGIKQVLSNSTLPAGYHIHELINAADQVQQSVNSMLKEVLFGALLASVITLLFLRDIRATIVALFSIPISILSAVIVMNIIGYSLNILTLSGVAVAVGRVVDDSIVVIENIYRRLRLRKHGGDEGLVQDATHEVGSAITSSTVTTVAVFLPLTLVPGIVGHMFAPFAWTVIVALAFSLLVALMIVPLISKWTLLRVRPAKHTEDKLQRGYRTVLRWSLSHKWVVIVFSILLLAETGYAFTQTGLNFLPSGKVQTFDIAVNMPVASNIDATDRVTNRVEHVLQQNPDVSTYQAVVSDGYADISLSIKPTVNDSNRFAQQLRGQLKSIGGATSITLSGNSGPGGSQIQLVLNGSNSQQLSKAADMAQRSLSNIAGLADVTTSAQPTMPQVQVNVDRTKAVKYGLDPAQVAGQVSNMINGQTVVTMSYQGADTPVNLMLGNGGVSTVGQLQKQNLMTPTGSQVELDKIATVSIVKGPTSVDRLNQQEYVMITGTITSDNQGAVTSQVNQVMKQLKLPAGISFHQEGANVEMNQGFQNMGLAMLASFLLVLIVMLIAFGNWYAPLAILFALPFALVGGVNGLWITNQPLGMPGMIGFMMLIGIIVTNAIVLIDRVERQIKLGLTARDALIEAGGVRLRPILMTATATIGALIPLSLGSDAGIISKSLAIVVIGGLLTSTLLTLVVVPIMFEWFYRVSSRLKAFRGVQAEKHVEMVIE